MTSQNFPSVLTVSSWYLLLGANGFLLYHVSAGQGCIRKD